jgi:hypothetical protein
MASDDLTVDSVANSGVENYRPTFGGFLGVQPIRLGNRRIEVRAKLRSDDGISGDLMLALETPPAFAASAADLARWVRLFGYRPLPVPVEEAMEWERTLADDPAAAGVYADWCEEREWHERAVELRRLERIEAERTEAR